MANSVDPLDLLEQSFAGVVREMPNRFTFHDFVRTLAYRHQHEYIAGLGHFQGNDRPFQALHAELERRLHNGHYGLILINSSKQSKNIFGISSRCGEWQKP